jgi:acetyl-CoA carboxylase biotin carboxyl carrier protein
MDLETLKQILDLVRQHNLSELEVEQDGLRLKVRTADAVVHPVPPAQLYGGVLPPASAQAGQPAPAESAPPVPAVGVTPVSPVDAAGDDADIELAVVKSPIVGTFYRSPEAGAPAFVEVGGTVKKGQVLCIIEAMKLMNEIDSEYDGEIVNIYVESGQPVQYGERLFAIRTK